MENRKTESDLFICMKTLLQSVDDHIQSGSISIVAEELVNPSNIDVYIPRAVSMGPRYNGNKEELLHMEEIKLRCMLSLFRRAAQDGKIDEIIKICNEAIWSLNDKIRASYVLDITQERYELTKIMLVDSCFLLELLITKGFELDRELSSHLNVTSANISPFTLQVLKNDDVLSDLTLFENQIPIFIVHVLSEILFPYFCKQDSKETETLFINLVLSVLGYSRLSKVQNLEVKPHHLLDVVHSFVNNNNNNNNNNKPDHEVTIMSNSNSTETQPVKALMKIKLKRCATRLQAAGVSIQLAQDKEMRGLDFEFKFNEGKLEIAALIITKTTEAKWRNVIAWEHYKMDWKKSYYNKDSSGSEISNTCGKFTTAALIFNDLICCIDDVKLLKDKNIIVDHTKKKDKELQELIRTMSFGVDHGIVGSGYVKMVSDLNDYSPVNPKIRMWKKWHHYFKYYFELVIKFMQRDYNFVATVVSFSSIVSAVYAIVAYHLPS